MTDVTIDLDMLISVVQAAAKTEEKMLHMQVESVLKEKLHRQTELLESLNQDWEDLLETIGFLFSESPSVDFDSEGYPTQPTEILEFAKRKMDQLEMHVELLEKAVDFAYNHAHAGLPHLVYVEGTEAFSVPTHLDANNELGLIRDHCSTVLKANIKLTDKYRRAARVGLYEAAKKLLDKMDKIDPKAKFLDEEYADVHNAITYYETTGNSVVMSSETKGYKTDE